MSLPKSELVNKAIISTNRKGGKKGFRVYQKWDKAQNKQAEKTQKWHLNYFIESIKKMKPSTGYIITNHDYVNVISLADKINFLSNWNLKEIKDNIELIPLGYITNSTYNTISKT